MSRFFIIGCSSWGKLRSLLVCLILFAAAGRSFGTERTAADNTAENSGLSESKIKAMEQRLATITDPAAKLFFKAGVEQAKGEPEQALKTLSSLIVHYAHNKKWIARAELLSAALYIEMGMLDAADVTARQVQVLYKDTTVATDATTLREQIKKKKEESEETE